MKKKFIANLLFFVKKALEVDNWVREDIREPLKEIKEIKKDPRLINFREKIDLQKTINSLSTEENKFKNDYFKNINKQYLLLFQLKAIFSSSIIPPDFRHARITSLSTLLNKLIDIIALNLDADSDVEDYAKHIQMFIYNRVSTETGEIKLTKLYEQTRNFLIKCEKVLDELIIFINPESPENPIKDVVYLETKKYKEKLKTIKKLEDLENFKEWQLRVVPGKNKGETLYDIVFTTNYKDIYGMSSRSGWTSCQDVTINGKFQSLTKGVIGSCVAKGIGIIYLTDNKDFEGRGEKMLYRSAVWVVRNEKINKDIIIIQKMYPNYDEKISGLFISLLKKHLNMDVFYGDEYVGGLNLPDTENLTRYVDEEEYVHPNPYGDIFIKTKLTPGARLIKISNFINKIKLNKGYFALPAINTSAPYEIENDLLAAIKEGIKETFKVLYANEVLEKWIKSLEDENVAGAIPWRIFELFLEVTDDISSKYYNILRENIKSNLVKKYGDKLDNFVESEFIRDLISYSTY